jgi:formamidopyrimidine-DNA glycosylase
MDPWTALRICLLGAGIGALLTAIAYARQVRELRDQVHRVAAEHERRKRRTPGSDLNPCTRSESNRLTRSVFRRDSYACIPCVAAIRRLGIQSRDKAFE